MLTSAPMSEELPPAVPAAVRLAALPVGAVLLAAAAMGAGAMADIVLCLWSGTRAVTALQPPWPSVAMFTRVTTMALAVVVVARAIRSPTPRAAAGWCLAGAAVGGMASAVLVFLVSAVVVDGVSGLAMGLALVLTPVGIWLSIPLGGVPGAIFGFAAAPLVAAGRALDDGPSLRDGRAAAARAGLWLFAIASAVVLLVGQVTPLSALAGAAGLGLLAAVVVADGHLLGWQRRLAVAGSPWRLVPRDPLRDQHQLPPLGRWGPAALCDRVLVHERAHGLGPYRTAVSALEIALVPRDLSAWARRDLRRSSLALCGCLAVALLTLLRAP
jgi:hypothetical protein